jgi:hypothetical protein
VIFQDLNLIRPWEFLGSLLAYGEAKHLARYLKVSEQTVKNWTRRPNTLDINATGRKSFLSYLDSVVRYFYEEDGDAGRAHRLGDYICAQMDSIRVSIPEPDSCLLDAAMLSNVSIIMKETAGVIDSINTAWFEESPGEFTKRETLTVIRALDNLMAKAAQIRMCVLQSHSK